MKAAAGSCTWALGILVHNAQLAVEVLGPRGAKAFGRALLAVGQQHVAVAERMLQLAEEKAAAESAPEKRDSHPATETDR